VIDGTPQSLFLVAKWLTRRLDTPDGNNMTVHWAVNLCVPVHRHIPLFKSPVGDLIRVPSARGALVKMATLQAAVFCVDQICEECLLSPAQRDLLRRYGINPPQRNSNYTSYKHFKTKACVCNGKSTSRPARRCCNCVKANSQMPCRAHAVPR
jgi:hypothetical protein